MNKDCIAVNIRPFVLKQDIFVYQDRTCIRTVKCKIDDIEKIITLLSDKYNINKINLIEPTSMYSSKIKENLLTQYADKNLEITIW